jgi:XTP/dITP diphosphohydrolase
MPRLLLATNNPGKLREIRELLDGRGWTVLAPADLGLQLDPEESGATYAENAAIKAHAFSEAAGVLALADDSGLEVDALAGRPGVHSARYGGDTPHAEKIRLLLGELEDVPAAARGARFRCVMVLAAPDGCTWQAEGVCEGVIAPEPRGEHGFGYDPIFLVPDYGRTFGELDDEVKSRISHRARAALAAAAILEQLRDDAREAMT